MTAHSLANGYAEQRNGSLSRDSFFATGLNPRVIQLVWRAAVSHETSALYGFLSPVSFFCGTVEKQRARETVEQQWNETAEDG